MPSASIALAMVLAVYMPPHEPAPGIACSSIEREFAVVERAVGVLPDRLEAAHHVELLVREPLRAAPCAAACSASMPVMQPGKIVPP